MVYQPQGVNFDGTNDYLTRGADLTGNADSKLVTASFWFRYDGGTFIWFSEGAGFRIFISGGAILITGENTSGSTILNMSCGSGLDDAQWHHCCFSIDMASQASSFVYVDDADVTGTPSTFSNAAIDFTRTEHAVGANNFGTLKFSGDLADFWLDFGTYIDLSVEANRRLFVGASAASSVDLGSDGSTPTGSAPIVFLSGPTSTWHTNDGTGGGFTENGALADASTNPPDDAASTNTTITAAQGSFTLSGQAINFRYFKTTAEQGTFTLTGQAANTSVGVRMTADQGGFVLSGQSANTLLGRVLAADQASFTLSGQAADLLLGEVIVAGQGTFTLSGQAAATLRGYYLGAEQGSYTLDGQDVEIRYFKLAADVGSFALTGQDATLFKGYTTTAAQGSFTLTGQAAGTFKGYKLALARGLYNLTGYDADFTAPTWQHLPINTAESWTDVSAGTAENWVDVDTGDGETWT